MLILLNNWNSPLTKNIVVPKEASMKKPREIFSCTTSISVVEESPKLSNMMCKVSFLQCSTRMLHWLLLKGIQRQCIKNQSCPRLVWYLIFKVLRCYKINLQCTVVKGLMKLYERYEKLFFRTRIKFKLNSSSKILAKLVWFSFLL